MIKKLLIVTILALITACSTLQKELSNYVKQPEVTYKSMSLGKVSMDVIELNPTFNISNKNDFSIPIDTVIYDLSLNNKKMLTGETDKIGTLPANTDKDVIISLDLSQETLTSLQQLLFKDKKLDYQVKGSVKVMGLVIPFEKSETLYLPEIKIRDIQVTNATFSQLDLQLSIDIINQNTFNLPLETLNYSVSSGGKTLFKGDLKNHKIEQGKNNIQLPMNIKLDYLFSSVFGLLANPELPLHFEINSPLFIKSYDQSLNLSSFF
jgi:LEA14-like dessication related protein